MTFTIRKASDFWFNERREINTLEDLEKLEKEFNPSNGLIITFEGKLFIEPTITIYDDYVE